MRTFYHHAVEAGVAVDLALRALHIGNDAAILLAIPAAFAAGIAPHAIPYLRALLTIARD